MLTHYSPLWGWPPSVTLGHKQNHTKFSDTQLKKVKVSLDKCQGAFLHNPVLIKHHKDTFGSNYMDHAKNGYKVETSLDTAHEACDQGYLIKTYHLLVTIQHNIVFHSPEDPSLQELPPSCKVYLMVHSLRRCSKARLLVTKNIGGRSLTRPYRLYLNTFRLSHGGGDGASQRHCHRGFDFSSLVVCRREKPQDFLWNWQGIWMYDDCCEK